MNARELRIGNLVIWNGDPEESGLICPIDGEDIDKMERSEAYSKEHSPIQLNEEWLLKFGFEDDLDKWYSKDYFTQGDEDNKIRISVNLISKRCSINQLPDEDNTNDTGPAYTGYDINFVHQLQNLYFALTSEELIMKEEK
jgi:hypothetical protein